MPSACGTQTSRRRPTKRCANCSRGLLTSTEQRNANHKEGELTSSEGAREMAQANSNIIAGVVREAARPLAGTGRDYDPLLKLVGAARFCLLGEATHGTHEFYRERAEITKRLITEKGFTAVAVEADWPDAFRVNRFVRGESTDPGPGDALGDFQRFPTWMWRNTDVTEFVSWLRAYNDAAPGTKVGFY